MLSSPAIALTLIFSSTISFTFVRFTSIREVEGRPERNMCSTMFPRPCITNRLVFLIKLNCCNAVPTSEMNLQKKFCWKLKNFLSIFLFNVKIRVLFCHNAYGINYRFEKKKGIMRKQINLEHS